MVKELKGMVSNIQRFCLHDGPGIRTLIFLKGCPLNCRWCANPELQKEGHELFYSEDKCILCEKCIEVCPQDALSKEENRIEIDRDKCNLCGECVSICYAEALEFVAEELSISEVVDKVYKDISIFRETGGGITLSGGEPLFQKDFSLSLLKEFKVLDIHTAVETAGYVSQDIFKKVLPFIDLFLYDIKHLDLEIHRKYTGKSNKKIINNLKFLVSREKDIIVRTPVIPGFNYEKTIISKIASFIADLGLKHFHLLPYHLLGKKKYEKLGGEYDWNEIEVKDEELDKWADDIEDKYGINMNIRGNE